MIAPARLLSRPTASGGSGTASGRRPLIAGLLGAGVLALLAGGCATATNSLNPGPETVKVARSAAHIEILVDDQGRTLYTFVKDPRNRSTCSGACASVWPPVTTSAKPTAQGGAAAGELSTFQRDDGSTQISYNGHPLYYYQADTKPGDSNGDAVDEFGADWFVATPAARASSVSVKSSRLGRILVDSRGRTLYLFERDTGPKSTCYGGCASVWPPVTVSGKPTAGAGASASRIATTQRTDGRTQLVYAGHPLYYYSVDQKPGDVEGQDLTQYGGKWNALDPTGKAIP